MENINENEVVATEAAPAPVILEPAVEVAEKVEKVITFNSIFKEAWGLFVYFFEEHTLAMILLLVVMIIPVINFLVLPIVILIAGRKISGEAEPFKGVVMMYLNKFWQLIVLGFVQIFALIWKILPIVIIPLILCTFEFTLGMHSTLLNYLLPISAVLAVVPFCLYLFKYMYGWAFAAQALFFEDKKEVSALKRSWELTFGNKNGIFYYLISLGLIIG